VSHSIIVADQPAADWDSFVSAQPEASLYHRSGWSGLTAEAFGHKPAFLQARGPAGDLLGVLPIVRQKSLLFGTFATSVPFFNYGGALAVSETVSVELMESARTLAQEWGCSYLELRDVRAHPCDWTVRTDKVTMILDLPPTFEELSKQLGSKLRSQVKRADREGAQTVIGGIEHLEDFYDVFCRNMRDLGTPVYPRRFFETILRRFPSESMILCVKRAGVPMAAAFLLVDRGKAEIPWASCREDAKPLGFNMKLYWEVLSAVMARGCSRFDFGRSTADSGTFRFKRQWGAQPVQLHWHRWERQPRLQSGAASGDSGAMRRASALWQRLPLRVANFLGPIISPSLPW
jgi:FemAB-related protein (PEP-CTERM system-associated)